MKKLQFLYLFFLLLFSCQKKFEYEYNLIADFPLMPLVGEVKLVITDADGNILGDFELSASGNEIRQPISLNLKEPLTSYNAHFILPSFQEVKVFSHLGVENNGNISFVDRNRDFVPLSTKNVKLILPDPSYLLRGVYTTHDFLSTGQVLYDAVLDENQGLLIDNRYHSNTQRKVLYLPVNHIKDTTLSENDLAPVTKTLKLPDTFKDKYIDAVYAVSPDEKEYVCLYKKRPYIEAGPIAIPANIAPEWRFYISYNDNDFIFHRYFEQHQNIDIEPLKIGITQKGIGNYDIAVKTEGPVDFITAYDENIEPFESTEVSWVLQGNPKSFEHCVLPDLSKYIDNRYVKLFLSLYKTNRPSVKAYHSGEYDYEDMARGFPWKNNDLFSKGRDGYEEVTK